MRIRTTVLLCVTACLAVTSAIAQSRDQQPDENGSDHVNLIRLCEIEENDDRRIADGGVIAGEYQVARFAIHAEDGDVVTSLITGVKELTGGIEIEAARIVPGGAFVALVGPSVPTSVLISVATLNPSSGRIGSTATEPPK